MKKNQKISIDFWHKLLTLKLRFWHLLTFSHYVNSQDTINSFEYMDFWPKNLSNFVSLSWKLENLYYHTVLPQKREGIFSIAKTLSFIRTIKIPVVVHTIVEASLLKGKNCTLCGHILFSSLNLLHPLTLVKLFGL